MEALELKNVIETLKYVSYNTNQEEFFNIFEELNENLKNHLWEQFTRKCKYDMLEFYSILDLDNQKMLLNYLLMRVNL